MGFLVRAEVKGVNTCTLSSTVNPKPNLKLLINPKKLLQPRVLAGIWNCLTFSTRVGSAQTKLFEIIHPSRLILVFPRLHLVKFNLPW